MHKQELKVSSLRASYSNYRIRRTHESIHELDDHFFEGVSFVTIWKIRYYAVSKQSLSSYENRAFGSVDDIKEFVIHHKTLSSNKNATLLKPQFQLGIAITNLPVPI